MAFQRAENTSHFIIHGDLLRYFVTYKTLKLAEQIRNSTMAQMAHFSFPHYFTIPNSEFRILYSEFRNLYDEFRNSEL